MAGRALISKLSSSSVVSGGSFTARLLSAHPQSPLVRFRPLLSAAALPRLLQSAGELGGLRCFATRPTTSSLNDPSPNWSNRPPKETILLDGCDFEHWLIVMEPPDPSLTRDEIIDSYIKTLAQVVGSEEEARMSIYSVSTKHYFAFGAKVSEELSYKIKPLPKVRWVLPDSYLDVKNKDYGGEPFIDGKAVPYDPKYHEEWVRNNARAQERSRRNDRPRNFDRSRNFERRRENMQNFQNRDAPTMANQEFQNRDAQAMPPQGTPPVPNAQSSMPPREMPSNAGPPNPSVIPNYNTTTTNQQSTYVPNAASGYQGHGFQGGPSGPGYQGGPGGPGPSGPGYQGGQGSPGYQGGPSGPGYQGGQGSPGYQGGPSGPGYQGGQGSPGYQGGPSGSGAGGSGYQGTAGGPGYQGGNPSYQGGNPGYQGDNPGYQGGNPGYQGGGPGLQGGNVNYQPGNPGHQAQPTAPGHQPGGSGYQSGGSSYHGDSPSYQQFGSDKQGVQARDMPGRDY